MGKHTLAFVISTVTLEACLALSGGAMASAVTSHSGMTGGTGKSKGSGLVQITAYSDNDGPIATAVLTGAIGDFGKAVRTYANGQVEQQYNRLVLEVSHGSFQLEIAGLERSLVSAFAGFPTDLNTCSGIEAVHVTTPIVPGSGSGAYVGIRGSFNMTITINEVDSWPKCPRIDQTLIAQTVFITGSGMVSFS